jgi:hypothetical protein
VSKLPDKSEMVRIHTNMQRSSTELQQAMSTLSAELARSALLRGVGDEPVLTQLKFMVEMTKRTRAYAASVMSLTEQFRAELDELTKRAEENERQDEKAR